MFKNLVFFSVLIFTGTKLASSASLLEELIGSFQEFVHEQFDNQAAKDETYELTYFDTKGRAEFIRWILASTGENNWKEIRVNETRDWPTLKPTEPFEQLPVLKITRQNENYILSQSKAIAIYLADRFDLSGSTVTEEAFANMYGEQLGDLFDAKAAIIPNNQTSLDNWYNQVVPKNFNYFEKRLEVTGSGFLAGESETWADIFLSQMTDFLSDKKDKILAKYPNVRALDNRVRSYPKIAAYLKTRIDN